MYQFIRSLRATTLIERFAGSSRGERLPFASGCRCGPAATGPRRDAVAGSSVIKPLVDETNVNVVLTEREHPALRADVTAHALRKTFVTFLHEVRAPPRWVADQGGHADPSTSLRIYTDSPRDRERTRRQGLRRPAQRAQRTRRGSQRHAARPLTRATRSCPLTGL